MKTFKYPVISIHTDLGKKDHILKDYVAMDDVVEMIAKTDKLYPPIMVVGEDHDMFLSRGQSMPDGTYYPFTEEENIIYHNIFYRLEELLKESDGKKIRQKS